MIATVPDTRWADAEIKVPSAVFYPEPRTVSSLSSKVSQERTLHGAATSARNSAILISASPGHSSSVLSKFS